MKVVDICRFSKFILNSCTLKSYVRLFTMVFLLFFISQTHAQIGCNCKDYLYVAEPFGNQIHKFELSTSLPITEVFDNSGVAWYDGVINPGIVNPHGLVPDKNGFLYAGSQINLPDGTPNGGDIKRLNKYGEIIPGFLIDRRILNLQTIGNVLFTNVNNSTLPFYSLCDGSLIGEACLLSFDGSVTTGTWDISYNPNTENFVLATDDNVWRFKVSDIYNSNANGNCISPVISRALDGVVSIGESEILMDINDASGGGSIWGVTEDDNENIYLLESRPSGLYSRLHKYDSNNRFVKYSVIDRVSPAANSIGFFSSLGLRYHSLTNRLYTSGWLGTADCVSAFDTNINYIGTAAAQTGLNSTGNGKAMNIIRECCPTVQNATIDTLLCNRTGQNIQLADLVSCDGGFILEGAWQPVGTPSGINYNDCDKTIDIISTAACGSFRLRSDGTNNEAQCGAFDIVLNVGSVAVTPPVISGNEFLCSSGDPAATTTITTATATGTILYQWQRSTNGCGGPWVDISGATSSTYNPADGSLAQTTYFRVRVRTSTTCASGVCDVFSNCIEKKVIPYPSVQVQNSLCDDNGTPDLLTDNRIRFSILVSDFSGLLSNYNLSVNGGTTITPNTGTYGTPSIINLGNGTAGGGSTFTVTITDNTRPECINTLPVVDPGNCNSALPPDECPTPKCGTSSIQINGN